MPKLKDYIYPIAVLSGTIIGVGFFSLPYIASKVGIFLMIGYFFILGSLVIFVHSIFGELAMITPDLKRFPGFAKFHLGKWGERVALISDILGICGANLAYLILGGQFLTNLLSPVFGGSNIFYTLLYLLAGAIFIYFGIKAVSKIEFSDLILFSLILIVIFFRGYNFIDIKNLSLNFELQASNLFLPYGPILFSLWGATLIPEVEEMLRGKKKLLKKIILISISICALFYFLFIILVTGISGQETSSDAISGLKNLLGNGILNLLFLFGTFTTFTSFIALGLTLEKVFWYDLKINKNIAWVLTCFLPLILFLIGVRQFIPVISFVGGVMLGIDGILILLMYRKINPKQILVYPLFLILFGGIIYEIIYFMKK